MEVINSHEKALLFIGFSFNHLSLVENVLNETIRQGNEHVVTSNYELLPGEYEIKTKWSDFNIIIPTLNNFYHGLELLMKGLILLFEEDVSIDHNLETLFGKISQNSKINIEIKNSLAEHLDKNKLYAWIITDFLKDNELTINQMYQALRYPLDTKFEKIREYYHLHYREEDGIPYFKKIINDSQKIRKECVELYRKITKVEST
jgi:hypothetical protein